MKTPNSISRPLVRDSYFYVLPGLCLYSTVKHCLSLTQSYSVWISDTLWSMHYVQFRGRGGGSGEHWLGPLAFTDSTYIAEVRFELTTFGL